MAYASMRIVLLLLIGTVIVVSLVARVLFLQRRFAPKLQFSLRGFLMLVAIVAIVAIILACTIGYRKTYMAQVTWIPVAKENAANLFPAAKVQKTDDGRFKFVYYARNRSIQRLIAKNNFGNLVVKEEAVRVTSRDEFEANDQLQRIQALSDRDPSVPVGAGFYFRIRSAKETADRPIRWHSPYFSLDSSTPEMLVDIRIPN